MGLFISLLFSLVPFAAIYTVIRHGPIPSRWWQGENPLGFGLFVGGICFLLGFAGPMLLTPGANQGPMLGIFLTGPIGLVAGFLWGLWRAARRSSARDSV